MVVCKASPRGSQVAFPGAAALERHLVPIHHTYIWTEWVRDIKV